MVHHILMSKSLTVHQLVRFLPWPLTLIKYDLRHIVYCWYIFTSLFFPISLAVQDLLTQYRPDEWPWVSDLCQMTQNLIYNTSIGNTYKHKNLSNNFSSSRIFWTQNGQKNWRAIKYYVFSGGQQYFANDLKWRWLSNVFYFNF